MRAQLLLPRQAAAPDGPVDASLMYLAHHAYRRDLTMLAAATAVTPIADRDAWRALASRWRTLRDTLRHQHAVEDAVLWPAVAVRGTQVRQRAALAALASDHAAIESLLATCSTCFGAALRSADGDAAARLASRLAETRDLVHDHLDRKETVVMPVVQELLTAADWARLERSTGARGWSLRELVTAVPWAVHEVPEAERETVLRLIGRPLRLLWLLTHHGFDRQDALATRHLV